MLNYMEIFGDDVVERQMTFSILLHSVYTIHLLQFLCFPTHSPSAPLLTLFLTSRLHYFSPPLRFCIFFFFLFPLYSSPLISTPLSSTLNFSPSLSSPPPLLFSLHFSLHFSNTLILSHPLSLLLHPRSLVLLFSRSPARNTLS